MSDAVKVTITDSAQNITAHMTCISDGTGETAVQKIARASYVIEGRTIQKFGLVSVRWSVQGFSSVRLLFDHTADDVCMVMSGNGYDEFADGYVDPNTSGDAVTGTIGDVLLTSVGGVSGATYDITAVYRKIG